MYFRERQENWDELYPEYLRSKSFEQMSASELIAYIKLNGFNDEAFNELLIKLRHPQAHTKKILESVDEET